MGLNAWRRLLEIIHITITPESLCCSRRSRPTQQITEKMGLHCIHHPSIVTVPFQAADTIETRGTECTYSINQLVTNIFNRASYKTWIKALNCAKYVQKKKEFKKKTEMVLNMEWKKYKSNKKLLKRGSE